MKTLTRRAMGLSAVAAVAVGALEAGIPAGATITAPGEQITVALARCGAAS